MERGAGWARGWGKGGNLPPPFSHRAKAEVWGLKLKEPLEPHPAAWGTGGALPSTCLLPPPGPQSPGSSGRKNASLRTKEIRPWLVLLPSLPAFHTRIPPRCPPAFVPLRGDQRGVAKVPGSQAT